MNLPTVAAKREQRAKADFKGRHYEATLIVQPVSWYLRHPLSYCDIKEPFSGYTLNSGSTGEGF
ncbi:hypothetical protein ASF57_24010 [Methylobacterium sp. Leaf117]|nr:hypothetical protein ASF57_24010 [Methylobacterium sp. Leaf117]